MDYGIKGRVIAVTGGASGIGLAIVRAALGQGARVAILDSAAASIESAMNALRAEHADAATRVVAHALDVRDSAACESVVERIEREFGPIDGLAACAGISRPEPSQDMSGDNWDAVIDINLSGVFRSVQSVGRRMLARGRGAVVAISSTDGFGGHAGRSHYAASKHGVIGLVRSLAIEWGRHGVRVNAVAPGVVDTPLLRHNIPPEHLHNAMVDRIPMARFSRADEQASATLFLLSDGASYINGTALAVDGGLTAGYFTRWNGADLGSRAMLDKGVYGPPSADSVR